MKRTLLLIGGLCAAFSSLAAWNLYKGAAIVKPRVDYSSQVDCSTGAQQQPPGNYTCRNLTVIPITVAKAPDHSMSGPVIDDTKVPKPIVGFSDARWQSIPAGCLMLPLSQDNCAIQAWIAMPTELGAFRIPCSVGLYIRDDPLVLPGQPGKSHMHAVYGNLGFNANSTQATLSTTGNSSCSGGTLVRSALWVPAVIDEKGAPVNFDMNYYQKGSAEIPDATYTPIPAGLRMVVGDALNTDPTKGGGLIFSCADPQGNSTPWQNTLTRAVASGVCKPGATMYIGLNFPLCWDGKNLDSPDHRSHMARAAQLQSPPWTKFCAPDHPVVLPQISYQLSHLITAGENPSKWFLSSDMDLTKEAGVSGHGDYWANLDPAVEAAATQHCLNEKRDGHDNLTCDGKTLY
jgi:hypothetical protein